MESARDTGTAVPPVLMVRLCDGPPADAGPPAGTPGELPGARDRGAVGQCELDFGPAGRLVLTIRVWPPAVWDATPTAHRPAVYNRLSNGDYFAVEK